MSLTVIKSPPRLPLGLADDLRELARKVESGELTMASAPKRAGGRLAEAQALPRHGLGALGCVKGLALDSSPRQGTAQRRLRSAPQAIWRPFQPLRMGGPPSRRHHGCDFSGIVDDAGRQTSRVLAGIRASSPPSGHRCGLLCGHVDGSEAVLDIIIEADIFKVRADRGLVRFGGADPLKEAGAGVEKSDLAGDHGFSPVLGCTAHPMTKEYSMMAHLSSVQNAKILPRYPAPQD